MQKKKRNRFNFSMDLGPIHFSIGRSWSELNAFFARTLASTAKKETVNSQLAEYRSWVQIAVNVIYRRVGEIPYAIYRSDTDEKLKKNSHVYKTVNKIFVDPNPFMEFRFMKQYLQMSLDMTGAAFLYKEHDAFGLPKNIYPMPIEDFVKVEKGETFRDWIKGFTFNMGGEQKTYSPKNILYFHYPDPRDPRDPCSPIKAQAYAVDLDHYIEAYERDFFKHSARPDTTIQYPENVTIEEEEAKRLIDGWKQKFQGEGKYHEVAVLDRGAELGVVNAKNEDLALMVLARWSQDKVLASYGVPEGKVGLMKDVNKASSIANDTTFNSECIKPRLDLQDEVLTRGILQKFDDRLEFRHDNPIPRDQEMDIKEHKEKVGVPTRTINEQREIDGDKPVPGGDVVMIPLNYMGLVPGLSTPSEEPGGPEEPKPGEEEEGVEEGKTKIQAREYSKEWLDAKWNAFRLYTEAWEGVWRSQLHVVFENQQEEVLENLEAYWDETKSVFEDEGKILDNFRLKWFSLLETYRNRSTEKIVKYFEDSPEIIYTMIAGSDDGLRKIFLEGLIKQEEEKEITQKLSDYTHTKQDSAIDYILFDYDENRKVFNRMGEQISGSILVEQANEELTALGMEANFSLENPTARAWLASKVKEFSREVLSTKADQLRRTLAEGFKKGEDIRRLSERVEHVYQGVINGRYDAMRIARTETIGASNKGSYFGYKASGVVKEKEWLSTRDQRTRGADSKDKADHYHMDGQRVKLEEPFVDPVSGAQMMQPGDTSLGAGGIDTIMCRCSMVPYAESTGELKDTTIDDFREVNDLTAVGNARARRLITSCYA